MYVCLLDLCRIELCTLYTSGISGKLERGGGGGAGGRGAGGGAGAGGRKEEEKGGVGKGGQRRG